MADLIDVPCRHEADGGHMLLHVPERPVGLQAGGAPAAPLQLAVPLPLQGWWGGVRGVSGVSGVVVSKGADAL